MYKHKQVDGVTVAGKDSSYLTEALSQKQMVGYIVCGRPLGAGASSMDLNKTMSPIEEVTSIESVTGSADCESGIDKSEYGSGSVSRISDLRRRFEGERLENAFSSRSAVCSSPKKVIFTNFGFVLIFELAVVL